MDAPQLLPAVIAAIAARCPPYGGPVNVEPGGDVGSTRGRVPGSEPRDSGDGSTAAAPGPLAKGGRWQLTVTDREYAVARAVSLLGIGAGLLVYLLTEDFQRAIVVTWVFTALVNGWALVRALRRGRAENRHGGRG
jgi:hypothetical protein